MRIGIIRSMVIIEQDQNLDFTFGMLQVYDGWSFLNQDLLTTTRESMWRGSSMFLQLNEDPLRVRSRKSIYIWSYLYIYYSFYTFNNNKKNPASSWLLVDHPRISTNFK